MSELRKLSGIVIDPGHGGTDSGAVGNNLKEKDYNLKISNYIYNRFKQLGIPVYLTRDSDMTLSPSERTNKILNAFGNDSDVIAISNHLNAGGGDGAEVIYALRNDNKLANMVLNNIRNTGQTTRKIYQRRLPSDNSKDYYFIHRNTGNIEPLIIEYGFIDNAKNVKFLEDNYQELGEAVIKAILEYKGIPYTPEENITITTYQVQKGDSLYSIAKKYNTTVNKLIELNNLSSNNLSIGQILNLPSTEVSSQESNLYTVKTGDTLYSIAKNNNLTVSEIKEINNLSSDLLTKGQVLILPTGAISENTYQVQKGDSLYSIAKKYNTTVDDIKRVNNLTSNILSLNQVLIIPRNSQDEYIVKSGDTIYSIAKKNNLTVNRLKELNNLTSNMLSVGQKLLINDDVKTYQVQKGDSLFSIAELYNVSIDKLKKLNNLSTDEIAEGQILIIS